MIKRRYFFKTRRNGTTRTPSGSFRKGYSGQRCDEVQDILNQGVHLVHSSWYMRENIDRGHSSVVQENQIGIPRFLI